jgi:hypothetical protein
MQKNNTAPQSPRGGKRVPQPITIGMDLGDRTSRYCELQGEAMREGSVPTTKP